MMTQRFTLPETIRAGLLQRVDSIVYYDSLLTDVSRMIYLFMFVLNRL